MTKLIDPIHNAATRGAAKKAFEEHKSMFEGFRSPKPMTSPDMNLVSEHDIKCWLAYYDDIESGRKPFELRKNDRDYREGDTLRIREFNPMRQEYTGRECRKRISYALHGPSQWGLAEGYSVLGLQALAALDANAGEKRTAPESCPNCFNEEDCSQIEICKAIEEARRSPPSPADRDAVIEECAKWHDGRAKEASAQGLTTRASVHSFSATHLRSLRASPAPEDLPEFKPGVFYSDEAGVTEIVLADKAIAWQPLGPAADLGYDFDGNLIGVKIWDDVRKRRDRSPAPSAGDGSAP